MTLESQDLNTQCDQEFGFAVAVFVFQFSNISTYRETLLRCLDSSQGEVAANTKSDFDSLRDHKPFAEALAIIQKELGCQAVDSLQSSVVAKKLRDARQAIEVSIVVFSFSLLDGFLDHIYQLALRKNRRALLEALREKKVCIADLLNNSVDELLREKFQEHVEDFQKKSIREKAERLYAVCKPSATEVFMEGYSFDSDELEEFRKTRVSIVHGQHLNTPVEDAPKWVDFAFRTGCHFGAMVGRKFGLTVLAGEDFFQKLAKQAAWSHASTLSK